MTPIHYRVERSLHGEMAQMVPELVWHCSQDTPEGDPPYAVLQADEAVETTPLSGVYYVKVALLVTHALGEGSGPEQAGKVQRVRAALEDLARRLPGIDDENAVRLYGFVVLRQVNADTEQEQGSLFELNVGCGETEKAG